MFPRALRTLHACLRCQHRRKPPSSLLLYVHQSQCLNGQGARYRWTSHAAVLKEERDGDEDATWSHPPPSSGVDDSPESTSTSINEAAPQNAEVAPDDLHVNKDLVDRIDVEDEIEEPRRASSLKFRHWKPPTTAAMDTNFLGQPGEILVLSETGRKKRHRQAEVNEESQDESRNSLKDSKKESVYETLTNENRPASDDEITKSIDEVRKTLPPPESHGSQAAPARRILEKSFSKAQLNSYIKNSPANPAKVPPKAAPRADFATYIVQHIWSLDGPEKGWNIPVPTPFRELIRLVKQYHPTKLDLRGVSESRDGLKGTLPVVRSRIEALLKHNFATRWLHKPRVLTHQGSRDVTQSLVRSWAEAKIEALARQCMILLRNPDTKATPNLYKASAFSKPALSNFLREVFLANHAADSLAQSLQPSNTFDRARLLPAVYRDSILSEQQFRVKHTAAAAAAAENVGYEELAKLSYKKLTENLLESAPQIQRFKDINFDPSLHDRLSTTFSAEFGKLTAKCFDLGQSQGRTRTMFSPHVPLLAEFLSRQRPADPVSDSAGASSEARISRLLFKPGIKTKCPNIEIYADLSTDNTIMIQQVNLQFPLLTEIISLPGLEIDIRFDRQDSLTLFTRNEPVEERLVPLIGSIARQLPFAHAAVNMYNPGNLNVCYSMEVDTSALKPPSESESKDHVLSYALETAQDVSSVAYTLPDAGSFILEFVSYTPSFKSLLSEPLQRSHTLRLTEKHGSEQGQHYSLNLDKTVEHIGRDEEKFKSFLDDVYKIASKINESVKVESQKLTSRYPKIT